ncbi:hypothetical protein V9T40_013033 [Parthenolecanium corni]|uniref:Phospholipase A-2-activating protein n=1 Tax=Parthenolecanium corni TaxID=536013 RepID=A0AAN9TLD0_9HEMI
MPYKLSCALYGHSSDVRDIAITHNNYIVSCSRDKTAKLWKPNEFNTGYTEVQTFVGHTNFVISVCVVPPNEIFTSGLIVTGSNDNTILVYQPESPNSILQLTGHTDAVCRLVNGLALNTILSASWDKSVKVWSLSPTGSQCLLTIRGHQQAVWAVLHTTSDFIVTGSADKIIKVHKNDGSLIRTLTGHTDCVRCLAELSSTEILSCSNDATIRKWSLETGDCLDTIYGHPNFIYNFCVRDNLIASSGEDRCVMIWFGTKYESIALPAQSVWSVALLANKDVVTGSSDGVVRIFTNDEKRIADAETLAIFESEVSASGSKAEQYIGGVKVSDLPGPETLEESGQREGQTKLVRENGQVICYSWSVAEKKWLTLGNVISGSGGSTETSGKVLYEGKEYDFVFTVDIDDERQLKLPYNKSEDPWFAAQAFIHKHNLPQGYLEQVANFIINNSKQGNVSVSTAPPEFADPFTGGTRYIPGNSSAGGSSGGDPFTGGNRYVPMDVSESVSSKNSYFPQTSYIRFDQANLSQILDKLSAFNLNIEDNNLKFSDADLLNVSKLADLSYTNYTSDTIEILKKLLNWPKNCIFPVLDILRLAVRNEDINTRLSSDKYIFGYLKDNLQEDSPVANQMLSLRTLCNLLIHKAGEQLVLDHKDFITETLGHFSGLSNKSLQIAVVTLMLNMATAFYKYKDIESQSVMLLNLINILPQLTEQESLFRALVTMGTVLSQSKELSNCIDEAIKQLIANCSSTGSGKVKECAQIVLQLLS